MSFGELVKDLRIAQQKTLRQFCHDNGFDPSKEDIDLTKQLANAGKTLGIRLLDHIMFNQKNHYSMKEHDSI